MELILFIIFGVVFSLIKSFAEQGKGQKPVIQPTKIERYPEEARPKEKPKEIKPRTIEKTINTPKPSRRRIEPTTKYEDIELQVQDLDEEEGSGLIFENTDDVVKGIIMSEILESPRFKKPHKFR
ncbi:hypothetical protein HYG86_01635 [Alkalicella caledoniensis]|uniref:Uncharacterized protein n=1 Tax=Alkalicella caledoniensis TaxID=2731377 RepID=A0A7G9W4E6_ALKCA|nr:hypothetical protein [Alkalicella caledoniensis]QNO13558.1 hypothetical protein HYG86_01635 [Alkalicella caledoniensis]